MLNKIRYKLVFNRACRLNRRGEGLIEIECSQLGRRIYFSTHTYTEPQHFMCGSVTGTDNAQSLNYALHKMIQGIESIELEYIKKGVEVSLPLLKDAVRANVSPAAKLTDFGTEVVNRSDRKSLTKLNYKTLLNNIECFRKGILITDVNYNFIVSYDRWLRESGIAHNTRVSRLRLLRALLNEAKRRDIISANPFERFRIQQMESKKGYISIEQLHRLERMELRGKEDRVRDAFLIGCYTGLRFSDVTTLRQEHINNGWLHKKMVKTGFTVDIPVAKLFDGKMILLIEKYKGDIGRLTKEIGGNTQVNKVLRPLLDSVGADNKITFHSSRHTFATLLGQKGLGITTIQKMLGHQKLATTQIYEEVDRKTIENDIKKLKKK
ncbi:MAG: site-specific integrase [Bacteroidales bacterium]|nr:site-specific integrase [Bacteroidales bacterium]